MNMQQQAPMTGTRNPLLAGALVLLVAALFSAGFHHWDEHFQILEFAGWKLGLSPASDLPWEFEARLRPALQPAIVVALHRFMALFGTPDPFLLNTLLRLAMAALSWVGAVLLLRGQLRDNPTLQDDRLHNWYSFLAFFLWFFVYHAVRFSSEGLSAALFIIAYATYVHPAKPLRPVHLLGIGLLLGLAFVARYQVGFMIAGLLGWSLFVARHGWQRVVWVAAGALCSVCLGVLLDRWFYGAWTLTLWTYFEQNLLVGKAASFGTEPWWEYFAEVFNRAVPPFSLLFLLPPMLYMAMRRRDPLTWVVLPFLLVHILIGHKEIRFLFPLIAFLPPLVIGGLALVRNKWWPELLERRATRFAAKAFMWVHIPLLLVIMLKPADADAGLYRTLYRNYPQQIKLLHNDEHPYHRVADINFLRRPGLQLVQQVEGEWPSDAQYLWVSRTSEVPPADAGKARLVYSSFPEWITRFNVGGWVDRTDRWYVWELRRSE